MPETQQTKGYPFKAQDIAVSIIICTRNRATSLVRTLDSLVEAVAKAETQLVELIVVDNGSADATSRIVSDFAAQQSFPVQLIHELRAGLGGARNRGIEAARGKLLAFTDDDCVLDPDYLQDLLRHAIADAMPVIRGGRVRLGDPADLAFTIKDSDQVEDSTQEAGPEPLILGCNMVIPRTVFARIGGFDARFGAGAPLKSAEDMELLYRARRAGILIQYVPDMGMRHFHGRRRREEIRALEWNYNFGNGGVFAKWMSRDRRLAFHLAWSARQLLSADRRNQMHSGLPGTTVGEASRAKLAGALHMLRLNMSGLYKLPWPATHLED